MSALSQTRERPARPTKARRGQDTLRVLGEAGFTDDEIRRYRDAGVVK